MPSIDLSVPTWLRQSAVVAVLAVLAVPFLQQGFSVAFAAAGTTGDTGALSVWAAVAVVALAGGGAVLAARRRDGDAGSVWGGIDREQYTGRFAESGGISREEQERAIDELREEE